MGSCVLLNSGYIMLISCNYNDVYQLWVEIHCGLPRLLPSYNYGSGTQLQHAVTCSDSLIASSPELRAIFLCSLLHKSKLMLSSDGPFDDSVVFALPALDSTYLTLKKQILHEGSFVWLPTQLGSIC